MESLEISFLVSHIVQVLQKDWGREKRGRRTARGGGGGGRGRAGEQGEREDAAGGGEVGRRAEKNFQPKEFGAERVRDPRGCGVVFVSNSRAVSELIQTSCLNKGAVSTSDTKWPSHLRDESNEKGAGRGGWVKG